MKILIYLNHPAHFHLFKNSMRNLKDNGHEILVLSKKKDILDELLIESGTKYSNILKEGRKDSRYSMVFSVIKRSIKLFQIAKRERPNLMIGTAFELAHIGKILKIPFVSVNEDDAAVIPLWSKYSYPYATFILSPNSCNNGKWNSKTINYAGYHELAYLHPSNFTPNRQVLKRYFGNIEDYVLIRFAKLTAHHDKGISGITTKMAQKIIDIIEPHAKIFITSERILEPQFEKYRININPLEIHHVLAFAKLYIGDSQTMAAEAAVLGIPFVRLNDFVGKIGYLNELENKYNLGFGIKPSDIERVYKIVSELIESSDLRNKFQLRRKIMLKDMINVNDFFVWFMEAFPESVKVMENDNSYLNRFAK